MTIDSVGSRLLSAYSRSHYFATSAIGREPITHDSLRQETPVEPMPTRVNDAVCVRLSPTARCIKPSAAAAIDRCDTKPPLFQPGTTIVGKYGEGKFTTSEGYNGTYFGMGGGHIGFRVDGFYGILMPSGKAVAFNPETKEAFKMQVEYGGGEFKITDVKEWTKEPFEPGKEKPLVVEGENKGVELRHTGNGLFGVRIFGPKGEENFTGKGFLDGTGTYFLAGSNGHAYMGHYAFDDQGKLQIFDRKLVE